MGLLVAIVLIAVGWWVTMLVDALKRRTTEWNTADLNQVVWVMLILFATFFGAVLYMVIARPRLEGKIA